MTEADRNHFFETLTSDDAYGDAASALGLKARINGKPFLQRGDKGSAVKTLQKDLTKAVYYTGPISGDFDEDTEASVWLLQFRAGIPQTGKMDTASWNALDKITGGSAAKAAQTVTDVASIFSAVLSTAAGPSEDTSDDLPYTPPSTETGPNWLLIGGIALGVVVIGGGLVLVATR